MGSSPTIHMGRLLVAMAVALLLRGSTSESLCALAIATWILEDEDWRRQT